MKLVVEIVDVHDLVPKDGQGSDSPFVEVDFENQLSRTRTVQKSLNPIWNQKLLFHFDKTKTTIINPFKSLFTMRRPIPGRNFLGRGKNSLLKYCQGRQRSLSNIPTRKEVFLSFVKGGIGLKVYLSPESDKILVLQCLHHNQHLQILLSSFRNYQPYK